MPGTISPQLLVKLPEMGTVPSEFVVSCVPSKAPEVVASLRSLPGVEVVEQIPRVNVLIIRANPQLMYAADETIPYILGITDRYKVQLLEAPTRFGVKLYLDDVVAPPESLARERPPAYLTMTRSWGVPLVYPTRAIPAIFIPTSDIKKALVDVPTRLTGKGVKIGVLDSGKLAPSHVQNLNRFWGCNLTTEFSNLDFLGHGGFCSTIIAGLPHKAPLGIVEGIAPNAEILSIKVATQDGGADVVDVLRGIDKSIELKCNIVNMSLGAPMRGTVRTDSLCIATEELSKHAIPVSACGNEPYIQFAPGASPHTITVGSVSYLDGAPSWYGSKLTKIDVYAYGGGRSMYAPDMEEYVYSGIAPGSILDGVNDGLADGFEGLKGSSFSTPEVTGILALWWEGGLVRNLDDCKNIISKRSLMAVAHPNLIKFSWATI